MIQNYWEDIRFLDLELETYETLVRMFGDMAEVLATSDAPWPALDVQWLGKKHTKAEFEAMKVLEADMEEAEINLRYLAFG